MAMIKMEMEMDKLQDGYDANSPMEVYLESDEEEASLLEEMEQQETNILSKLKRELHTHTDEDEDEDEDENKDSISLLNRLLMEHKKESTEDSIQDNDLKITQAIALEELYLKSKHLGSRGLSKEEEAQILQLNMSTNDLLVAKSTFGIHSQNTPHTPAVAAASNAMTLDNSTALLMNEHGVFSNNLGFIPTGTNIRKHGAKRKRTPKNPELEERSNKSTTKEKVPNISGPEQSESGERKKPGCKHENAPMNDAPSEGQSKQLMAMNLPAEDESKMVKEMDLPLTEFISCDPSIQILANLPKVYFGCHFCQTQFPLTEANFPAIVTHMNPTVRYNQVLDIPDNLLTFRENIKLGLLLATDKSEAQVQVVSRLECSCCGKQFIHRVQTTDNIVIHNYLCKCAGYDYKNTVCIFCEKEVAKVMVKKHLQHRYLKSSCKKMVMLTLQYMSSVCEKYVEEFKPICVVCNEREWPYRGQQINLRPTCESCRTIIVSGVTTELRKRKATKCAICGVCCANKFVTYWPTKYESLFIGESCMLKLNNPERKVSDETTTLQASKIHTLLKRALSSLTVQSDDGTASWLAPHIHHKHLNLPLPQTVSVDHLFPNNMELGKAGEGSVSDAMDTGAISVKDSDSDKGKDSSGVISVRDMSSLMADQAPHDKHVLEDEDVGVHWTESTDGNESPQDEETADSSSEDIDANENNPIVISKYSETNYVASPVPSPPGYSVPLKTSSSKGKESCTNSTVVILKKPQTALRNTEKTPPPPKPVHSSRKKFVRLDLPLTQDLEGSCKPDDGRSRIVIRSDDKEKDGNAVVGATNKEDAPQTSLSKSGNFDSKVLSALNDSNLRVIKMGNMNQSENTNSDLILRVVKTGSESSQASTNKPPAESPQQGKVFKAIVRTKSTPPDDTPKLVSTTTVEREKSKYVIKYVSALDNKTVNPIVIRTSSNVPPRHNPVKPPKLTKVIRLQNVDLKNIKDKHASVKDKWESVKDKQESVKDKQESVKDKRESVKDKRESVKDKRESVKDKRESVKDKRESVKDKRESVKDKRESVKDKWESVKDNNNDKDNNDDYDIIPLIPIKKKPTLVTLD